MAEVWITRAYLATRNIYVVMLRGLDGTWREYQSAYSGPFERLNPDYMHEPISTGQWQHWRSGG